MFIFGKIDNFLYKKQLLNLTFIPLKKQLILSKKFLKIKSINNS